MNNPIKIELWDCNNQGNHVKIGEVIFTLTDLYEVGNKNFFITDSA